LEFRLLFLFAFFRVNSWFFLADSVGILFRHDLEYLLFSKFSCALCVFALRPLREPSLGPLGPNAIRDNYNRLFLNCSCFG